MPGDGGRARSPSRTCGHPRSVDGTSAPAQPHPFPLHTPGPALLARGFGLDADSEGDRASGLCSPGSPRGRAAALGRQQGHPGTSQGGGRGWCSRWGGTRVPEKMQDLQVDVSPLLGTGRGCHQGLLAPEVECRGHRGAVWGCGRRGRALWKPHSGVGAGRHTAAQGPGCSGRRVAGSEAEIKSDPSSRFAGGLSVNCQNSDRKDASRPTGWGWHLR